MINVGTAGRKDFSIDGTLVGNSDSVLPTEKAVKTYVDNSVVGLLDDRGDCDASVNTFPATGGSGTAGAVLKGDTWRVSVAGTLGGTNVNINDWVRALTDTPGQTSSNWAIMAQFDNSFTDFDASTNPNYPASTKKGQRWKVTVAGKVGGVSGKTVKVGDTFESLMVSTGGTELAVGSEFIILTGYGPFGTMSLQDASNVNITGGAFTGLTGAGFRDTSAAFDVTMGFTSSTVLDAARSITWDVKNASHQLKFTAASIVTFPSGTVTLAQLGANTFTGQQVFPVGSQGAPALAIGASNTGIYSGSSSRIDLALGGASKHTFWNDGSYYQNDTAAELRIANRVSLYGRASNHLGIGAASATPVAQTLGGAQGAGTNITGGDLNLGTQGTGTGTGGRINLQTHAAGSSGTTLGTLVNVLSIISPGVIRITGIPTSSAGLSSGDVYSNAGILTIVT